MHRQAHVYEVNGVEYSTIPMPATEALRVLPKIGRLLGEYITATILEAGEDGLAALLDNSEVVAAAVHTIAENAGEDGLLVVKDLMRHTTMLGNNGEPVSVYEVFDDYFAGNIGTMLTVAIHAARASFTKP